MRQMLDSKKVKNERKKPEINKMLANKLLSSRTRHISNKFVSEFSCQTVIPNSKFRFLVAFYFFIPFLATRKAEEYFHIDKMYQASCVCSNIPS